MRHCLAPFAILVLLASPAVARNEKSPPRSQALTKLVNCRSITAPEERLACYDREVAALQNAAARNEIAVVDREQVRKTRRSLFGLTLPDLSIFGDDNEDEAAVSRIEAKIKSVYDAGYGRWGFVLDDGAQWVQTDNRKLAFKPKPGQDVVIHKAALGSYMANINKQNAIRVERVR